MALWQAVGVSALVCGMGAGLAVAAERYHRGFKGGLAQLWQSLVSGHPLVGLGIWDALGLTLAADLGIVLTFVLAFVTVRGARVRARHRRLLDLLANHHHAAAGTRVLEHPRAVAYCIPGLRPRIVISDGTIAMLSDSELAAVVAHERGHAVERHGLVMVPMVGLRKVFHWVPYAVLAPTSVAGLLEMAADEYALRRHDPGSLLSALVSMATAGIVSPACAFDMASHDVARRVERLLACRRTSKRVAVAALTTSAALFVAPVTLLALL